MGRRTSTAGIVIAVVAALWGRRALAEPADPSDTAASQNPDIAAPGSDPEGQSYSQWAADWWRWALAQRKGANPVTDETGQHCAAGQTGNVWFLAGNLGGTTRRACTVPYGRSLFFPVVTRNFVQTRRDNPNYTFQALRTSNRRGLDNAQLSVTIDGKKVFEPRRYFQESTIYKAVLPDDNIFDYDQADCSRDETGRLACWPALDAGFYLFLRPLPRGAHVIRFIANAPASSFSLDVTYKLRVE